MESVANPRQGGRPTAPKDQSVENEYLMSDHFSSLNKENMQFMVNF